MSIEDLSEKEQADLEQRYREVAQARYTDADLVSFDDTPPVALSDDNDGAWVQAWLWIRESDLK